MVGVVGLFLLDKSRSSSLGNPDGVKRSGVFASLSSRSMPHIIPIATVM